MVDHPESHVPVPGGKSGPSAVFSENVEPEGRKIFGPAPSKSQPTVGNVFNDDKDGKRKPGNR